MYIDCRVEVTRILHQTENLINRNIICILADNKRCGISVNRRDFEKYHRWVVDLFDKREAKICSVIWCMNQIKMGWCDIIDPMRVIMATESLEKKNEI